MAQSDPVTVRVTGEVPTPTTGEEEIPTATATSAEEPPTPTTAPPTPTGTRVPPTSTPIPPTSTRIPPTSTPRSPTATPQPVRIVSFEVSKSQITRDECVRFTWRVEAPTAIYFDGEGVGNAPDSRDRCPTATREFELRAEGQGGPVTARLTVVVIQPPEDTTGPIITNVEPEPQLRVVCVGKYCAADDRYLDIEATVTDGSGVGNVQLYHTAPPGGGEPEPQREMYGNFTRSGGNVWVIRYTPPEDFYAGIIKFEIKATDDSPNLNTSWWGPGTITIQQGIG